MAKDDGETLTFNRRINFYILRKLWLFTRKEKRVSTQIYEYLGMSRTRYERFISGENVRVTSEEEETWIAKGLPKAVFTGKAKIEIPYAIQTEWDTFFDLRSNSSDGHKEAAEYQRARKKINKYIKNAREQAPQNELLAKVLHFIDKREDTASREDILLAARTLSLRSITVEVLQQANISYLNEYISILQAQLDLSNAVKLIKIYKNLK